MASEREAGCCSDRETVGMQTARSILTGVQGVAWRADGGARRVPANGRRGSAGLSPSPGWRWEEPGRARSPSRNARESLSQTTEAKTGPNTRSGDPQSFQTHKVLLTASRIPRAAGSGARRSRTGPFRPTSHCRTINPAFPALLCLFQSCVLARCASVLSVRRYEACGNGDVRGRETSSVLRDCARRSARLHPPPWSEKQR